MQSLHLSVFLTLFSVQHYLEYIYLPKVWWGWDSSDDARRRRRRRSRLLGQRWRRRWRRRSSGVRHHVSNQPKHHAYQTNQVSLKIPRIYSIRMVGCQLDYSFLLYFCFSSPIGFKKLLMLISLSKKGIFSNLHFIQFLKKTGSISLRKCPWFHIVIYIHIHYYYYVMSPRLLLSSSNQQIIISGITVIILIRSNKFFLIFLICNDERRSYCFIII